MAYKVIVVMTTYNLEKYIGEALNSVVCQKTDFPFKILIGDDASTDGTIDIINRYSEQYPGLIELRKAEKNMGSLKNSNRLFDGLECEYFSFLDGDDMWLGDTRLQEQVEFLDSHPEYTICAGNTYYLYGGNDILPLIDDAFTDKTYTMADQLSGDMPFFHTSSMLVRNVIFADGLPQCFRDAEDSFENCALRGEDFRRYLHLEKGSVYVMKEFLSMYRVHERGMWQGSTTLRKNLESAIGANFYRKYWKEKKLKDPRYAYFDECARTAYGDLIKQMIADMALFPYYKLNEKDSFLFTSLLNDISKQKNA